MELAKKINRLSGGLRFFELGVIGAFDFKI